MGSRLEATTDVRGFLALRSAGLAADVPLKTAAVVMLPHVVDTVGAHARGRAGRAARVSVRVSMRKRLLRELSDRARRSGAVGLVDVRFEEAALGMRQTAAGPVVELSCTALPVKPSRRVPEAPFFATTLRAADVASLLIGGWVPVEVLIAGKALNRASRHRRSDAMAVGSLVNQELRGASELIQRARRQLREYVAKEAAQLGADGVLLHHGFQTEWSPTRHLVEVGVVADSIAKMRSQPTSATRTVRLSG